MEQNLSWVANRFSTGQEVPCISWNSLFITHFTSAHHLSLLCARSIQPMPPPSHFLKIILILSSHLCLCLPSHLLPLVSPLKPCMNLFFPPTHLLYFITQIFDDYRSLKIISFSTPLLPHPTWSQILSSAHSAYMSPPMWGPCFTPIEVTLQLFTFLDSRLEDKRFCTKRQTALPDCS